MDLRINDDGQNGTFDEKKPPLEGASSGSSEDGDLIGPLPEMLKNNSQSPQHTNKHTRFFINNINDHHPKPEDNDQEDHELSKSPKRQERHARFSINNVTSHDDEPQEDEDRPGSPDSEFGAQNELDDDHQKTHGSHTTSNWTYYTQNVNKSLRRYITEALPRESNYRNILSIGQSSDSRKYSRPTLDQLREPEENGKLLPHRQQSKIASKVTHPSKDYYSLGPHFFIWRNVASRCQSLIFFLAHVKTTIVSVYL